MRAFMEGNLEKADLTEAERALMKYVELVTKAAYRNDSRGCTGTSRCRWKEEQIAEAVYIIALFAMFNRIANAFAFPCKIT